jgi:hypothetical protein
MCNKVFNISFQGSLSPLLDPERRGHLKNNTSEGALESFYLDHLPEMEQWFTWNNNDLMFYSEFYESIKDCHPSIMDHLRWVKEKIYPKLGLTMKDSTIEWAQDLTRQALELFNKDNARLPITWDQGIDENRFRFYKNELKWGV